MRGKADDEASLVQITFHFPVCEGVENEELQAIVLQMAAWDRHGFKIQFLKPR